MKIRADFVTNSSSSNYITLEITTEDGKTIGLDPEKEYFCENLLGSQKEILNHFMSMKSMSELLGFLELDQSDFNEDISRLRFKKIESIEVGKRKMFWDEDLHGNEWLINKIIDVHTDFLKEMAEMDGEEYDPDAVDWDEEVDTYYNPAIVGNIDLYDLKNKETCSYEVVEGL